MQNIDTRFVVIGVTYALLGMIHGDWMGVAGDYTLRPLHAHVALIGGVFMILKGLVYRAYPRAAADPLAPVHFWLANTGAPVFFAGIYLAVSGKTRLVGHAGGALVALAMVLFLVIILRARKDQDLFRSPPV